MLSVQTSVAIIENSTTRPKGRFYGRWAKTSPVHAKDQNLLQDMRSCNDAIIAGPDQSLPAQIEFSMKPELC